MARFCLLLFVVSATLLATLLFANKSPQVLAHRGASGHAPETTLASFRLALQMKVDFLEFDVHLTSDGEIVAIHDSLVDRTTNGNGAVGQKTLAQLKKLDAGSWFNRTFPAKSRPEFADQTIPTLQEIIDLARESPASLYIETKNPELYPPELEAKLLDVLRRNQFDRRFVIQSFSGHSLEKVRALDSGIPTALLIDTTDNDPVEATLAVRANELALNYKILTPDIVKRAHDKGLTVAVWTVDMEDVLKRMIEMGVDRIITNYPDRLNLLLGKD